MKIYKSEIKKLIKEVLDETKEPMIDDVYLDRIKDTKTGKIYWINGQNKKFYNNNGTKLNIKFDRNGNIVKDNKIIAYSDDLDF